MVKGFTITIGHGSQSLTIENTDKSGCVSFIEHDGTVYNLDEKEFIKLSEKLSESAEIIKRELLKKKPIKATLSISDDTDKPKVEKKKTKKNDNNKNK